MVTAICRLCVAATAAAATIAVLSRRVPLAFARKRARTRKLVNAALQRRHSTGQLFICKAACCRRLRRVVACVASVEVTSSRSPSTSGGDRERAFSYFFFFCSPRFLPVALPAKTWAFCLRVTRRFADSIPHESAIMHSSFKNFY